MGDKTEEELLKRNCENAPTWDCHSVHRKSQPFLSAHVDDIKMVGKEEHLGPMWKNSETSTWNIRTPLLHQVHVGCTREKQNLSNMLFKHFPTNHHHRSDESDTPHKFKVLSTDHRVELRHGRTRPKML